MIRWKSCMSWQGVTFWDFTKKCAKMTVNLYGETGWYPLYIDMVSTLNYHKQLVEGKSSQLLQEELRCNKLLHENSMLNWYSNIVDLLKVLGLGNRNSANAIINIKLLKSKMKTRFESYWRTMINGISHNDKNNRNGI